MDIDREDINSWNTTKTEAKAVTNINIIRGRFMGGNYWAKPDGTGYSQTCGDFDKDGICDEPYVLEENNIDYLPLTLIPFTDVAVTDITISPEEPELGDTINSTITIQNLGDIETNAALSYSISWRRPDGGRGGGRIWLPCDFCIELEPREIYSESFNFFIENPGEYEIYARVRSEVHDINPGNNELAITFVVEEPLPILNKKKMVTKQAISKTILSGFYKKAKVSGMLLPFSTK